MENHKKEEFEAFLDYLKHNRGFDFTGYKRTSLVRRVNKRMAEIKIKSYQEYSDYLEVQPDEFISLFNTILINVTSFFRDSEAWKYLEVQILPKIISEKGNKERIRVWCAGSATGEEAYSVAILLAELLGEVTFTERVKIYATDLEEDSLTKARQGTYLSKKVQDLPAELLERYFERNGNRYTFRKNLRKALIFGRHDIIQDAPISRIDLLVCRNLLMYFNMDTQAHVLERLHFAVRESGYLFLGKAEMLLNRSDIFKPVNLKYRVFKKVEKTDPRDRLHHVTNLIADETEEKTMASSLLSEKAFNLANEASLIVDREGLLVKANQKARKEFNLINQDIGRPIREMQIAYRPVALQSYIDQAYTENRTVEIESVEVRRQKDTRYFLVRIIPLTERNESVVLGVYIRYDDITNQTFLQEELEQANNELETAMEELQSTNEELETTNEELQSTIEELETTNEELQSTNEELETMNEELQSTNQEMDTINRELGANNIAYDQLNNFLESILSNLSGGVTVLDQDLHIKIWNKWMEGMWGLREDEVLEKNFLNLEIGLPVTELKRSIQTCLTGKTQKDRMILDAHNRIGKAVRCEVIVTPIENKRKLHKSEGAILLMYDMDSKGE
ncbi:MAG: CheR family methyltransferase [Anaerolineales bacterium]